MSDTPKLADECVKLLDNGWTILLFRNDMGSYTAVSCKPEQTMQDALEAEKQVTDDFLPSQALYRLTEKICGNIV